MRWLWPCSSTGWAKSRHSFEQQRYRASGLNLVTAAIVLWNTVYLDRATQALRETGKPINDGLLARWTKLFDNLDKLSLSELQKLINKIESNKAGVKLSPEDLKTVKDKVDQAKKGGNKKSF